MHNIPHVEHDVPAGSRARATSSAVGWLLITLATIRGGLGQTNERDARAKLVCETVAVTGNPEAGGSREEVLSSDAARLRWVPGKGLACLRIQGADTGARHRAGTGFVPSEGVVQPALVALDVDRCARCRDRVERVAARVVDPCRCGGGSLVPRLEARCRVADRSADVSR